MSVCVCSEVCVCVCVCVLVSATMLSAGLVVSVCCMHLRVFVYL